MRIFLIILALFSIPELGEASINPSKMEEPLLDIFNGKIQRDGHVKVPVTTYNSLGELKKNGSSKIIDPQKFETLKTWATPVFRMQPNAGSSEDPRKGTGFHIGNNLILTNQHVLDPNRKNLTQCDDFRLLGPQGEAYPCKRVIFCNNAHDICLIEMAPKKSGCLMRGFLCRNPQEQTMDELPSIKMRARFTPAPEKSSSMIVTAIGNSMGLGIHASQGRGVLVSPPNQLDNVHFYAPVTKGNSGGVILDEEGIMIGLVKQQSALPKDNDRVINPVGDHTYNIALRVEKVIELSREALKAEPKTLEKFNQSVLE